MSPETKLKLLELSIEIATKTTEAEVLSIANKLLEFLETTTNPTTFIKGDLEVTGNVTAYSNKEKI